MSYHYTSLYGIAPVLSLLGTWLHALCFFNGVTGYVSARLYKTFKGTQWQRCTVATATWYPGICFLIFLALGTPLTLPPPFSLQWMPDFMWNVLSPEDVIDSCKPLAWLFCARQTLWT